MELSNINISLISNIEYMFGNCYKLSSLCLDNTFKNGPEMAYTSSKSIKIIEEMLNQRYTGVKNEKGFNNNRNNSSRE